MIQGLDNRKFIANCRINFFKIVIVTYFPGAKEHSPFSFYLCSSIPGVDPLAAQARSLEEDHGGVVGEDVRTSVRRLQELALDNNVDFVELALEFTFKSWRPFQQWWP